MAGTEADLRPAERSAVSLSILFGVFPIIFLGELPDKTMFASLVLSTKGQADDGLARGGRGLRCPRRYRGQCRRGSFHSSAAPGCRGRGSGDLPGGRGAGHPRGPQGAQHEDREERLAASGAARHRQTALTAFIVIFIAEWGDLTQVLTANLAARLHSPLSVAIGSVLALWAVAALAVIGGRGLLRSVNVVAIRIVTAVILTGLGIAAGVLAIIG
jgi:Ca2+/H+ antiporter, TMEM165/GDT1 family